MKASNIVVFRGLKELPDLLLAELLDGNIDEFTVVPIPLPTCQLNSTNARGKLKTYVAFKSDQRLFTQPRSLWEWSLLDDLIQTAAKSRVTVFCEE
ncbi:MAG: hypothetical protein H7062_01030 [Candidatus Saccharimonas sp.]|nr:hypothetical protein [Planctomycetaceae bacterium]